MKSTRYLSFLLLLFLGLTGFLSHAQSTPLNIGAEAPGFTAPGSQAGSEFEFSLKKALEKGPVVLYFFPSAYTGGCDLEAHTFAQHIADFKKENTTIIGVSADNLARLNQFSADPDFCAGKFPIATDPEGKIAGLYGLKMQPPVAGAKDVNGDEIKHGFFPRTTFVINANGKIVKVFSSSKDGISPDQHVTESLAIVKKLK